jgi:hypothetical protein
MKRSSQGTNGAAPSAKSSQLATISERKLKANRENAKKSTGPKTLTGKAYSRRNALKHGFFAKYLFRDYLSGREDPKEFQRLLKGLQEDYEPVGLAEELEVESIAIIHWKLIRVWRYENADIHYTNSYILVQEYKIMNCPQRRTPPEYLPIIALMADADKEYMETGNISAELGEELLAVDPSLFEGFWDKCGELLPVFLRGEPEMKKPRRKIPGGIIGVTPRSPEQRKLLARYWQLKYALQYLELQGKKFCKEMEDLNYDRVAIPSPEALNSILRCEAHLQRSLSRALDRLERLQRRRKGEPVLPPVSVHLTQ